MYPVTRDRKVEFRPDWDWRDLLLLFALLALLTGVVLGLITLFSGQGIGVELAAILLIFTGMTWNMIFSFYQSLSSIPKELIEASRVYRLNLWQRFWTLELPSGAIALVWNSVMSVAGGWLFLIAIEYFTLGKRRFHLPELGSYLATSADRGDFGAIGWRLLVLIEIIVIIDFLIWRPLIAWAEKFKLETVEAQNASQSVVLDFLRRSPTLRVLKSRVWKPLGQAFNQGIVHRFPYPSSATGSRQRSVVMQWLNWLFLSGVSFIVLWGTWEAVMLLLMLNWAQWQQVIIGAILTALRVFTALVLSLAWTVPVGVAIGRNARLAQILQPLVQIAASVPATALFPVLLLALTQVGGGLQIGSIILMMLGTMWYLLFNVIAGAQSIPSDLFEAARVYKLSHWQRWQTVILPGIFPYLITGIITAVGGDRNASIVSEYIDFKGRVVETSLFGCNDFSSDSDREFSPAFSSYCCDVSSSSSH